MSRLYEQLRIRFYIHQNFPGDNFGVSKIGYGGYYPYDYYDDYRYNDTYYDDGSCYVVQRRVHATHGWRQQPVQVCG
jgi:hypothetical protein